MELRTQVPIRNYDHQIDFTSRIMCLGSCFSTHISDKLFYNGFQVKSNPFGIFFHTLAIEKLIQNALNQKCYDESDVFFLNERWHCFDAHSDISNSDKDEILSDLNRISEQTAGDIVNATHITITLGTSWCYRNEISGEVVANCHKVPQNEFKKHLLSVAEIKACLINVTSLIRFKNPKVKFIFTVSPVRHIKDGIVENQRSKSNLIVALHNFLDDNSDVFYFPSYEIMMDELRDYRFYTDDMLHPTSLAINYIWEIFSKHLICKTTTADQNEIRAIRSSLLHRPFNPSSDAHQKFLAQLRSRIAAIQTIYPHLVF